MTEQINTRNKVNPWDKNKWPEKNSAECHILKLTCEAPANTELTGVQRHIKALFRLDTGRSKGAEFDAIVTMQEAVQAFKFWLNIEQMAVGETYTFDVDDQPTAMVVWRNSKWGLSDIQTDLPHRMRVITDMMAPHGLGGKFNTAENREKIREFNTTADAKRWAEGYIKEHSKPMAQSDSVLLDQALGRKKGEPPADEPVIINGTPIDELDEPPFPHELDPKKAVFAIPNHMAKTYGKDSGKHVRNVFHMDVGRWLELNNNDTRQAWGMVLDYEVKNPVSEEKNQEPSKTPQNAPQNKGEAISTPNQPQPKQNERSSEAKQLNNPPVDSGDKKSEIRERYNKPRNGNDYLMVQGRVVLFRLEHPDWTIETEHILLTEQTAVYKATVRNPEGRIIATGHGRATEAGTKHLGGRYIEKAETAAIGRALALAGFGTDDTLDDEDYIADSPVKVS